MLGKKGTIAIMGSGELTSTMVEVHKELLRSLGEGARALFLDTPAGFQLNADDLSQRAVSYFRDRVGHPMGVASFKSRDSLGTGEAEKAYRALGSAQYMLIGPGSPTYALSQWQGTLIPEIFKRRIEEGACLVAASAAALTVGSFTLPVYEIYKVGQNLHWLEGLRILDHFRLPVVVIPHWNNAEGGTHDTRFCYMGESRFQQLEELLPSNLSIMGVDEHTACILDLEKGAGRVKGIGRVTLRRDGSEMSFQRGDTFSFDLFYGPMRRESPQEVTFKDDVAPDVHREVDSFWHRVQALEADFHKALEEKSPGSVVNSLLELDRVLWQAHEDLEDPEFIAQARERYGELLVQLGFVMESFFTDRKQCLKPLVESLLQLRNHYRQEKRWTDADALRQCLQESGIVVEDTPEGVRWNVHQEE